VKTPAPIKALSLSRPWPWTILHLPTDPKRIENRSDKRGMPPMCRYRGPLLLHAAKSWDKIANWCANRGLVPHARNVLLERDAHPTGIVGRCRVVGHVEPGVAGPILMMGRGLHSRHTGQRHPDRIVFAHSPEAHRYAAELDLRWWMGDFALILDDVEPLDEPIPCKGRLGLWTPPEVASEGLPEGWAAQT